MSREDLGADGASDGLGPSPAPGRDDSGWLRVTGRSGCDPVHTISRADATRSGGEGQ